MKCEYFHNCKENYKSFCKDIEQLSRSKCFCIIRQKFQSNNSIENYSNEKLLKIITHFYNSVITETSIKMKYIDLDLSFSQLITELKKRLGDN